MLLRDINSIKKYLFYDVFSYFIDAGIKNEKDRYLQKKGIARSRFVYSFSKIFLYLLNLIYKIKLKKNKPHEQSIYFYADPLTYSDIVFELSKNYNLFFNNPLRVDKRIRFKSNIFYFPFVKQATDLTNGFLNKKDNQILESINQIKSILETTKPKIIVLYDSTFPINRAIIQVSKELGIRTIEIQHATYPIKSKLLPGLGADFLYVWGEYFKEMYEKQKIRNDDSIKILGYPFESNLKNNLLQNRKLTLYYLAQGFQYEDIKNLDRLLENALYLKNLSNTLNITFKCKLHPNSPKVLLDKVLPHLECNPLDQTMENAINDGDIFVSFNSTALIKAAFQGKKCFQLMNLPVECDNFEELGICKTFLDLNELNAYLTNLLKSDKDNILNEGNSINDKYIKTFNCGPGMRFANLIEEIESNNHYEKN
tara:strand:+ start:7368 stop:8642 length:1275 start_codon:yes stop_codon:yes gene_type:complete